MGCNKYCGPECKQEFRKNKTEILDDTTAKIFLENDVYCLVDKSDLENILKYVWRSCKRGKTKYAYSSCGYMHRFILNPGKLYVDHKNGNGLDNRRDNIRLCTHQQNLMNRGPQPNCKSGYKGVYPTTNKKNWRANIMLNDRQFWIGTFKTKEEAAEAYNKKSKEMFGDFAYQNIIKGT